MKKLLALLLTLSTVLSISVFGISAFADEEETRPPTYSFDTALRTTDFAVFGSGIDANMSFSTSKSKKVSGTSLEIKANCTEEMVDDFGGIHLPASALGLESFAGCKIHLSYFITSEYAAASSFAQVFATEPEWDQSDINTTISDRWRKLILEIPADHPNTYLGIKIPMPVAFSGTVMYVDNIYIYDANGELIENLDSYIEPEVTTRATTKEKQTEITVVTQEIVTESGSSGNIVIIIVAVIAVAAIAFVVIMLIRRKNKFY